ncbi:hypothetical protein NECAME_02756 [Necator americanus]|uniref:Uncharacterized protein n=1 Tax=Necator americanus TaxID=51031 RepID=W2TD13_NECAM|nr:hypothetical protein NECAME_02756 [Necator americanus]ETN78892.1 hypothetical protein NECAME_02756 [Necator americanus]
MFVSIIRGLFIIVCKFEEVVSGALISVGLFDEEELAAMMVAETKTILHCNPELGSIASEVLEYSRCRPRSVISNGKYDGKGRGLNGYIVDVCAVGPTFGRTMATEKPLTAPLCEPFEIA